jgi:hypothetical protein
MHIRMSHDVTLPRSISYRTQYVRVEFLLIYGLFNEGAGGSQLYNVEW